jgi:hypothetical protein
MSNRTATLRIVRITFLAGSLIPLTSACAIVDQVGPRAADYNGEAAVNRNSTILLNIIRAAYAEPLQFTDMTTVAGTASIGGTFSPSVPAYLNTAAALAARNASIAPSATASGGSTVNVGTLNTQEFYNGLQTPLTTQQIAYYLLSAPNAEDAYRLLPLFVADIEISSKNQKSVLHNSARSPRSFFAVYSAINSLRLYGLSVEASAKKPPESVGPKLDSQQASDPRLLAAIVAAAGGSDDTGSKGLTLKKLEKEDKYQFQKEGGTGGYRFCFGDIQYPFYDPNHPLDSPDYSIVRKPKQDVVEASLGYADGVPIKSFQFQIGRAYHCGASSESNDKTKGARQKLAEGLSITTRSVEGIFFYLGEIVRTELGLATGEGVPLDIPMGPQGPFYHLFRLEQRPPGPGELSVTRNGQTFTMAIDPSGATDGSSRVLQVLSDLLALQSSAKNLPAPNLIAITAQ